MATAEILAWIRRSGAYDGTGLPDPADAAAVKSALAVWPDYHTFRSRLSVIARTVEPLPAWDGRPLRPNTWLCPIDDDDWHSPDVYAILSRVPSDVAFVWWDVAALRWVPPAAYDPRWLHHGRLVPGTCGYAVRAGALPQPDTLDFALLRDDHVYAIAHAVRLNLRPIHIPAVGGVWNVTPASVSILREFAGRPPHPSPDDVKAVLSSPLPHWVRPGAAATAQLIQISLKLTP